MHETISDSDITVLIQGPYDGCTDECISGVLSLFSNSNIIFSTWDSEVIPNFESVKIIRNTDPGAVPFINGSDKPNNLNRLIVSTRNGLKQIETKFTLKLRSDLFVKNKNFLNYFNKYYATNEYRIFNDKLLCSDIYTLHYELVNDRKVYTPFHVSDWWYFGYTDDLKKLYDCPLVQEPDFSQYFADYSAIYLINNVTRRMSSEQYILSYLAMKMFDDIEFVDSKKVTDLNYQQSNAIISSNFVPLGANESGIYCLKEQYKDHNKIKNSERVSSGLITYDVWFKNFYRIYCK